MKNCNLQFVLAVLMVVFGIALIITSFIVPPTGQIHATVLTAYGETLTFVGAVVGIDYKHKDKQK